MTRIITLILLALASVCAQAQSLTPAQITTLRTNILASELAAQCTPSGDGPYNIAAAYNLAAAPDFWVYRTAVSNEEIGNAMNGTEVAGLSSLGMQRLQVLGAYSNGSQNFARADRRDAFNAVFSGAGGTTTRASLAVMWRRQATRFERLYVTGTGGTASPGTMAVEGTLTPAVVMQACSQ